MSNIDEILNSDFFKNLEVNFPEQAKALRKELNDKSRDGSNLKIVANFKLEKFDGDNVDGQQPVEVIESSYNLT